MTKRLVMAAAAALLASASASQASIVVNGSYTAYDTASNSTYKPTINVSGSYLPGSFQENLAVGNTTTPTPFLQIAPVSGGSSVGTISGTVTVGFTLSDGSAVTGVTYTNGDNVATLSGGVITVHAYYDLFYNPSYNQTDCITWSSTTCSAGIPETIGDTLGVTFADGAVLDVNLYNWSDWVMSPNISFKLANGPFVPAVPEPASFAVLGTALAGLGALRWRRRQTAATAA